MPISVLNWYNGCIGNIPGRTSICSTKRARITSLIAIRADLVLRDLQQRFKSLLQLVLVGHWTACRVRRRSSTLGLSARFLPHTGPALAQYSAFRYDEYVMKNVHD